MTGGTSDMRSLNGQGDSGGPDASLLLTPEIILDTILQYREQHGRSVYKHESGYHFLSDNGENKRLDLQHHIWYLTLNGKLGLAPPINRDVKVGRVLDLGTGTGLWATDYAEDHPEAEVVGIDVKPTHPRHPLPNLSFQTVNYEDEWTYPHQFDYIHSRMANRSVMDWKAYIRKAYASLAPGGYLELQEFNVATSDDATLLPTHALFRTVNLLREAAAVSNHTFVKLDALEGILTDVGFEDVKTVRARWASNSWPEDPTEKELGRWNNENFLSVLHGFLMNVLPKVLGGPKEDVGVLVEETVRDVNDSGIHAYWPVITVYGRKPEDKI